MIRILLVDDSILIRSSFKLLLSNAPEINIIGECSDGCEVLSFLNLNDVDVIFMDINMKIIDGYEATEIVKANYPEVRVIGFSSDNDDASIQKMRACGADGFISKTDASRSIIIHELEKIMGCT